MKFFSSLLMILILAMNFKPCADELISQEPSIEVTFQKTSDHQHEQEDGCSPFCYCACCSVRAHCEFPDVTVPFLSQVAVKNPAFTSSYLHQITLPVWQPPQLV